LSLFDVIEEEDPADEIRHARLTWMLAAWKLAYYYPEMIKPELLEKYQVEDWVYDQHEVEYLTLCRKLGEVNTSVHKTYPGFEDVENRAALEIDFNRPSVQLILSKIGV
jgi:hypothetical protein